MRAGRISIPNRNHYLNPLIDCLKVNGIEKTSKQYESIVNYMQSDLKW